MSALREHDADVVAHGAEVAKELGWPGPRGVGGALGSLIVIDLGFRRLASTRRLVRRYRLRSDAQVSRALARAIERAERGRF